MPHIPSPCALPACTSGAPSCPDVRVLVWVLKNLFLSPDVVSHPHTHPSLGGWQPHFTTPSSGSSLIGRSAPRAYSSPRSWDSKRALLHGTSRSPWTHTMHKKPKLSRLYNFSSRLWADPISPWPHSMPTSASPQLPYDGDSKDFSQKPEVTKSKIGIQPEERFLFFNFISIFLFVIVIQAQLSPFSPHNSALPHQCHFPPSILPHFGFVHGSFIHVPWWPFSFFFLVWGFVFFLALGFF